EEVITAELVGGNDVRLVGFGTFDVLDRAEHEGRNPRTKEPMTIPASKAPRFRAGKALKDAVNGR
ncbi:MAG: HU family DNA-binding protein, partial [Firmicutes bacterium]|nr:HU family DNA-binding protein [Bacillota bacterium]